MLASRSLSPELCQPTPGSNQQYLASAPDAWAPKSEVDEDETTKPRNSAHELLPKQVGGLKSNLSSCTLELMCTPLFSIEQRVALYATVRRRYMEQERADVRRPHSGSNTSSSIATSTTHMAPGSHHQARRDKSRQSQKAATAQATPGGARTTKEPKDSRRQSGCGVRVYVTQSTASRSSLDSYATLHCGCFNSVDITLGCDVRLHKQVASSSTPWRYGIATAP